jgi:hypothetical protein
VTLVESRTDKPRRLNEHTTLKEKTGIHTLLARKRRDHRRTYQETKEPPLDHKQKLITLLRARRNLNLRIAQR